MIGLSLEDQSRAFKIPCVNQSTKSRVSERVRLSEEDEPENTRRAIIRPIFGMNIILQVFSRQHNFILLVAILIGFCLPSASKYGEDLIIPLLMCAMTLSLSRISLVEVLSPRNILKPLGISICLNFFLLGGLNIALGYIMTDDPILRAGFVILASAPPSLTIPPFSYNLKGDVATSYIGTAGGYIAAIVLLPLSVYVFLGSEYTGNQLFVILGQLIILPLVLSQLVRSSGFIKQTERYAGRIINWVLAIVIYTLIGLNRDLLLASPNYIIVTSIAAVITIFALGEFILRLCHFLNTTPSKSISYMLLGSMKKWAGASAIAFVLFGKTAALPALVAMIFGLLYFFWLSFRFRSLFLSKG